MSLARLAVCLGFVALLFGGVFATIDELEVSSDEEPTQPQRGGKPADLEYGKVIELSDANFTRYAMVEGVDWLIEFYAPSCGHCRKFAPEYEELAREMKAENSLVRVGKVDAIANRETARRFLVRRYPTIFFFKGATATEYKGGRTKENLKKFAESDHKKNQFIYYPPLKESTLWTKLRWLDRGFTKRFGFSIVYPAVILGGLFVFVFGAILYLGCLTSRFDKEDDTQEADKKAGDKDKKGTKGATAAQSGGNGAAKKPNKNDNNKAKRESKKDK